MLYVNLRSGICVYRTKAGRLPDREFSRLPVYLATACDQHPRTLALFPGHGGKNVPGTLHIHLATADGIPLTPNNPGYGREVHYARTALNGRGNGPAIRHVQPYLLCRAEDI